MSGINETPDNAKAVTQFWVAHSTDGSVVKTGICQNSQSLSTGQDVFVTFDSEQDQLNYLNNLSGTGKDPMPPAGTEIIGTLVYTLAGESYQARRSHTRTSADPKTEPDNWLWVRNPGDFPDWVAGETVSSNDHRNYQGSIYVCLQGHFTQPNWQPPNVPALWTLYQATNPGEWEPGLVVDVDEEYGYQGETYKVLQYHITQVGWEPPNVPALFALVVAPGDEWAPGVAYEVDDEVDYQSDRYKCLQAHTSQVGWEPPNVPALWELI